MHSWVAWRIKPSDLITNIDAMDRILLKRCKTKLTISPTQVTNSMTTKQDDFVKKFNFEL